MLLRTWWRWQYKRSTSQAWKESAPPKNKELRFASPADLGDHLDALWTSDYCRLSGLLLDTSGTDPDLTPSLNRIDSAKHYEPGNLQVVARFENRWKSDDDESDFLRLLGLLRAQHMEVIG